MNVSNKIKILNYKNLIYEKLEYKYPIRTNYGSNISNVLYRLEKNNCIPIYIETPILTNNSGLLKIENKFYIDLEVNINSDFMNFFDSIDEKNIVNCHFNSKDWFSDQIPYDVIENFYKSPIKFDNKNSSHYIRVKIPSYRGKVLTEIFDSDRRKIDISHINKNDKVVAILHFSGLKFLSQQFMCEWEVSKLKILKKTINQDLPSGYLFSDNTEIDTDNNRNNNKQKRKVSLNNQEETNQEINQETNQEDNEESNQEDNEESNQEDNEESNQEDNEESNKEVNKEDNKETTQEVNKEDNKETTQEVNEEDNKESNQEDIEETNKEYNKKTNQENNQDKKIKNITFIQKNNLDTNNKTIDIVKDNTDIIHNKEDILENSDDEEFYDSEFELDDEIENGIILLNDYEEEKKKKIEQNELKIKEEQEKMEKLKKMKELEEQLKSLKQELNN